MYKRSTKIIRVSCETYKNLEKLGTLADSFDSVIQRLLTSENKRRYPHITMSKQTSNSKLRDTHDTVNTTANDTRKEDTPIREIYCCMTSLVCLFLTFMSRPFHIDDNNNILDF
jgi:predicted CopG family antitoxin